MAKSHTPGVHTLRALLAAGVLAAAACSPSDPVERADENLASAEEALAEGRLSEAEIFFKNAVQAAPDYGAARLGLGRLYMRTARYDFAEQELRRALEGGAEATAVQPLLLNALIEQGKNPAALELIAEMPDALAARPGIRAQHADALLAQGRRDEVRALLGPAEELSDSRLLARLAQLAAVEGDLDRARELAQQAIAAEPQAARAHLVQGLVDGQSGDLEGARSAFERALEIDPRSMTAGLRAIQSNLALGDLDRGSALITEMTERLGERVPFIHLRSMIALERGEFETAKTDAERLLNVAQNYRPSLYVAGIANAALGNLESSISQLNRFVSGGPAPSAALKTLAWAYLRIGQPESALAVLEDSETATEDLASLRLAVTAAVQSENPERAKSLLADAVEASPDEPGPAAGLAALQLASGDREAAQRTLAGLPEDLELQDVREKAQMALLQLRAGNTEEALELAEELKVESGQAPGGFIIAGLALVQDERYEPAMEEFRAALERAPGNRAAALALATIHQRRGETAEAESVLRGALEAASDDSGLLTGLVELLSVQGRSEDAENLLASVAEQRPEDPAPRILLSRLRLLAGRPEEALAPAQAAAELAPDSAAAAETLGRIHQALGNAEEAREAFARLAELRPEAAEAQVLLARAASETGDVESAERALRRALELAPGRTDARIVLARLLLARDDLVEAGRQLDRLADEAPDSVEVVQLQAAHARARGELVRAAELYERAWTLAPRQDFAAARADILWRDGRRAEAVDWLEGALAELDNRSEDQSALGNAHVLLAQYYYQTDALEKAVGLYRRLVNAAPDNPVLRNQLAWTLWEAGEAQEARPHAERAYELAPDSPEIMDTLGVVLLDTGEAPRAAELLRAASEVRPEDPAIKFHLAQALVEAGETEEARGLLRELAAVEDFGEREAAAAMLERLGG